MDYSDDVAGHAAIGMKIAGTKPSAKTSGAGQDLAALVDGRFGKADPAAKEWLAFAPTEEGVELTVDFEKPTDLKSHGINLLVSSKASANFPAKIEFRYSEDGTKFEKSGGVHFNSRRMRRAVSDGLKPQSILMITPAWPRPVRSIKFRIENKQQWVFIDEVMVNPIAK